jgi:hypothetical protein
MILSPLPLLKTKTYMPKRHVLRALVSAIQNVDFSHFIFCLSCHPKAITLQSHVLLSSLFRNKTIGPEIYVLSAASCNSKNNTREYPSICPTQY